jgi:hypothetical protein
VGGGHKENVHTGDASSANADTGDVNDESTIRTGPNRSRIAWVMIIFLNREYGKTIA